MTRPWLSIVIPAYDEERRIIPTLEKISAYLAGQPFRAEIVVADDGSADRTRDVVTAFAESCSPALIIRVIALPHQGKGGAVREGMLAAEGDLRFLCDADLSMPIGEITKFLEPISNGCDVVIGSREGPGAQRLGEPGYRHLMGRIFNLLVRMIAVQGFDDTQCGFKMFRAEAAEWLFQKQTMNGFGFDVEILYLARKRRLRVKEIPITWYHVEKSKIRPFWDTVAMIREACTIRLNDWRGRYGSNLR